MSEEPRLTSREIDILRLIASGLNSKAIAARLGINSRTVDSHIAHAYVRTDAKNRAELVLWAYKRGFLDIDE